MKLEVTYLNTDTKQEKNEAAIYVARYNKRKTYESQQMDEDMKVCTVSHRVERVILNDVQITAKHQVDDMIEFLQNLKPSLIH